ncbi:MAG: LysE family translocator [Pikeienuella sp.]
MTTVAAIPWTEIFTALAVFAANILSPGPNVFNTIAIAVGAGRRVALAVVPAIALGVLGWALAAILGAAALFRAVPALQAALGGIGGVLLIWFALRYARAALAWRTEPGQARQVTPRAAFLTTLAVLATNPKALTTWLVLVSIFPAGTASAEAIAVMVLGAVLVASAGHGFYALVFSTRAAARLYARVGAVVLAGVAVFFASLGASLLWRAIEAMAVTVRV